MHYAWGREHQSAGRLERARSEYRRVLQLNPRFGAAAEALDSLGDPEPTDKGVFGRLFRRKG